MLERDFQASLIKEIKTLLPGCMVLKNDPTYLQGIPDLLILHNGRWAALECKNRKAAHHQANQDYYVSKMNDMSYAAFISPENRKEILDELLQTLEPDRTACVSGC